MVPRRPLTSVFFLLIGIPFCGYVLVMSVLANMLGGLSDNAHGGARVASAEAVLPFAVYFACGAASALSTRTLTRRVAAVVGHLAPFACLRSASGEDIFRALVILAVMFGVFAV